MPPRPPAPPRAATCPRPRPPRRARAGVALLGAARLAGCATSPCLRGKADDAPYIERLMVTRVDVTPAAEDDPRVIALRRDWSDPQRWSDGRDALYAEAPAWRVRWIVRDPRLGQCAGDPRLYESLLLYSCDLGLGLHVASETLQIAGTDVALPAGDRAIEAILIDPSLALDDAPEGRVAQVCPLLHYSETLSVRSFKLPPATLPD